MPLRHEPTVPALPKHQLPKQKQPTIQTFLTALLVISLLLIPVACLIPVNDPDKPVLPAVVSSSTASVSKAAGAIKTAKNNQTELVQATKAYLSDRYTWSSKKEYLANKKDAAQYVPQEAIETAFTDAQAQNIQSTHQAAKVTSTNIYVENQSDYLKSSIDVIVIVQVKTWYQNIKNSGGGVGVTQYYHATFNTISKKFTTWQFVDGLNAYGDVHAKGDID